MDKQALLNYLSLQAIRCKEVSVVLDKCVYKERYINQLKQKWKTTIRVCLILAIGLRVFYYPYMDYLSFSIVLFGIGIGLYLYKRQKIEKNNNELHALKEQLNKGVSESSYQEGLVNFPKKFYNTQSVSRLYHLINEGRVITLQEAYDLLETQQAMEYQTQLAEQTLYSTQETEKNARTAAISSTISAFNSFRRK